MLFYSALFIFKHTSFEFGIIKQKSHAIIYVNCSLITTLIIPNNIFQFLVLLFNIEDRIRDILSKNLMR